MSKFEFKMPKMGESITEGTIINWLVNEGDSFEEGDILLEVATDKVDNEVPAPASGIMTKLMLKAKDVVPVGETIAILETKAPSPTLPQREREPVSIIEDKKTKKEQKYNPIASQSSPLRGDREGLFISPLILSIAKEHHISFEELARIPATGQDGRLRKSDVFQYIEDGRPYKFAQTVVQDPTAYRIPQLNLDKGKGKIIEMDRMRQMIADHMVYSKHTSPHVTAYVEADLTNMVNWRNANKDTFQKKYGEKLTFTPLFVEAVAKAVKDFPNINASVDGTNIIVKEDIN